MRGFRYIQYIFNFLKNTYKWIPKYLTFDFGGANIKAVNDAFTDKEDITIITYLFHLMQCWWRKAGALGLRKRKYINDTKLMLFNMELLCFMKLKDARNY